MARRINVVLEEDTVRTIDRIASPGQRSRFIERAVQHYMATASPQVLNARLKAAALRDRDLDAEIAEDWSAVGEQQWQTLDAPKRKANSASPGKGRSTSRRSNPR